MDAVIFTFTPNGVKLGMRVAEFFSTPENNVKNSVVVYTMEKFCSEAEITSVLRPYHQPVADYVKEYFSKDALIFIGAAGIAVRMIAPLLKHKTLDPCVLVLDELGEFVIPILSGHIGGGNDLALSLSAFLNSTPIITTATDRNHLFAVDTFAAKNNLIIDDLTLAKKISAALLEQKKVGICSQSPLRKLQKKEIPTSLTLLSSDHTFLPDYLIQISATHTPWNSLMDCSRILYLIPRAFILGIGCRKGITCKQIEDCVFPVFKEYALDMRAVFQVASIDLKSQEPGLLEFCQKYHWNFTTYSAEQLSQVQGAFATSAFVKNVTGVDNVCERAALAACSSAKLYIPKHASHGVTVAVSVCLPEIKF